MQNIGSFNEKKVFCNWLFSIALNSYRDRYRKVKRWLNKFMDFFSNEGKDVALSNVQSSGLPPDEQVVDNELKKNLTDSVNSLEDTFRIPIILFCFKQLRYEDISEILDIPAGTVKSRLNAGKSKLRKLVNKFNYSTIYVSNAI